MCLKINHKKYFPYRTTCPINYPDIFLPNHNLLIEVKSTYTYSRHIEKNICKLNAAKKAGYNIELRIYLEKGELLEKITP